MATADTPAHDDSHGHDDHGEFIAHHFDNAEQQYDSGKLGIWLFLVTEVLFFSGLFVAYTLYRIHHPEIFAEAHVFLDKILGGLNTVVLLFSSLTMAWAVRCAQLGKNKGVAILTLLTMVCAAVFIGVKAVEYSHKWDQGILVRSAFHYTNAHPVPTNALAEMGVSDWLFKLSIIPAVLLVGFTAAGGISFLMKKTVVAKFMICLAITTAGYFLGAVGGQVYMSVKDGGESHASQPMLLYAQENDEAKQDDAKQDDEHSDKAAEDEHGDENKDDHAHDENEDHAHSGDDGHEHDSHSSSSHDPHHPDPDTVNRVRDIGIFFSIYYCMTGLHAIHIIGGIIALAWILWRSLLGHWRSDYFGPVDYVGLYWHLVDLIWIFLFPLLYLID